MVCNVSVELPKADAYKQCFLLGIVQTLKCIIQMTIKSIPLSEITLGEYGVGSITNKIKRERSQHRILGNSNTSLTNSEETV